MNEAIAFDTHRYIKHLTRTGFTEEQAEALSEEQVRLLDTNLATKGDLARVEAGLKTDIARVEASLKADIVQTNERIVQVEIRLVKWVVGSGIAIVAVIASLLVINCSSCRSCCRG